MLCVIVIKDFKNTIKEIQKCFDCYWDCKLSGFCYFIWALVEIFNSISRLALFKWKNVDTEQ